MPSLMSSPDAVLWPRFSSLLVKSNADNDAFMHLEGLIKRRTQRAAKF